MQIKKKKFNSLKKRGKVAQGWCGSYTVITDPSSVYLFHATVRMASCILM